VEIPHRLLAHTRPGTSIGARLEDTGRGTFLVGGSRVTDVAVLDELDMPAHETSIEVPIGGEVWVHATTSR
jgi:hypothetical protein